jgi:pSer/pThr/pTyr-binding forkhead associated (FHA) protein
MSKEPEDKIDAGTPALFVLCGATRKKWRPLQGDVVMLGRSSGCDIGLVSPEVAPVHCVIVRTLSGWRIRDCSGRATRVNGKSIQDEPLRNGDVLQIGTFSFEAKLPAVAGHQVSPPAQGRPRRATVVTNDAEREKLLRSRRNLVDIALGMRRRLRDLEGERQANEQERKVLEQQRNDLEQIERRLRQAHKDPLAKSEAATELERMAADKERAAAEKLARVEARQAELDSYAQHLRRQADRAHAERLEYARRAEAEHAEVEAELIQERVVQVKEQRALETWQQHLARRQTELEAMAGQLTDVLQHERDQFEAERAEMVRERASFEAEKAEIARARAELEEFRSRTAAPAPAREKVAENGESDRLAAARKLLQDLQQRRKNTVYKPPSHPVLTPPSHQG